MQEFPRSDTVLKQACLGAVVRLGVIDLLNATTDGWNVVDYKSDLQVGSGLPEQYRQQLAAYRRALEACGLTNVSTAVRSVRR